MDVFTLAEGLEQGLVAREMRQDAQLDLTVVGRQHHSPHRGDEHLANAGTDRRANGDVLQVGIRGRQATGGGDSLRLRLRSARFSVFFLLLLFYLL